jgi:hypothetical protein
LGVIGLPEDGWNQALTGLFQKSFSITDLYALSLIFDLLISVIDL